VLTGLEEQREGLSTVYQSVSAAMGSYKSLRYSQTRTCPMPPAAPATTALTIVIWVANREKWCKGGS
jgi:hypothetical protein